MKRSFSNSLATIALTSLLGVSVQAKELSVIDQVVAKTILKLNRAKALIGPNLEIAGTFVIDSAAGKKILIKKTGEDYTAGVISNFAFGDINQDGVEDLAVIIETSGPMKDGKFATSYGPRSLRVYLGDKTGRMTLIGKSSSAVLRADQGEAHGDPLNAVEISRKTGVIKVSHFGGSVDTWGVDQKFQLRGNEMILVSRTETGFDSRKNEGRTRDVNYLTGEKITKVWTSAEGETRVSRSSETVRSPIKMEEATVLPPPVR